MVIHAARRVVLSRLKQAGCARLTEEASHALWRAAARHVRRGAYALSTGDILGAARRVVLSML
jgi:hypothetical protein